jgi:hypothetical protein
MCRMCVISLSPLPLMWTYPVSSSEHRVRHILIASLPLRRGIRESHTRLKVPLSKVIS